MNMKRSMLMLTGIVLALCSFGKSDKEPSSLKQNSGVANDYPQLLPSSSASSTSHKPSIKSIIKRVKQKATSMKKPRPRRSFNHIPTLPDLEMSNHIPDSMWPYDLSSRTARYYHHENDMPKSRSSHQREFDRFPQVQPQQGYEMLPYDLDYDSNLDFSSLVPRADAKESPLFLASSALSGVSEGNKFSNPEVEENLDDLFSPLYSTPLDPSAFPDLSSLNFEKDTSVPDLDFSSLLGADLSSSLPESTIKESNAILDDFLNFLDLRESGALDKCLGKVSSPT